METLIVIVIILIAATIIAATQPIARKNREYDARGRSERKRIKHITQAAYSSAHIQPTVIQPVSLYKYERKNFIMTKAEAALFRRLERVVGSKYYIFPQIHLSSLLSHEVKNGQDWRAALSKIQRKSVDFVLVNKESLITSFAIELDDRTHDISTRVNRDDFVNEIFRSARIPLVRLRNPSAMTDTDIIKAFTAARQDVVSYLNQP